MGAQENGLTLQVQRLAERLETLERENEQMRSESAQMRSENAELRHEVAALRGSGARRDEIAEMRGPHTRRSGEASLAFEGRVSRRSLLSKAGAAAVAAVAAGTLLNPRRAEADHGGTGFIEADVVSAHQVDARSESLITAAVYGHSERASGVQGYSSYEVGVAGRSDFYVGVFGGGNEAGVVGRTIGVGYDAFGVKGETRDAIGVKGIGLNGVVGESFAGGHGAVYGHHKGSSGYGVVGDGTGSGGAGVLGRNSSGYGGQFEGGKAQLMLKPGNSAGKPTTGTHTKGEIYMDKAGALFVCTAGDGTTVGTWKRVSMKLV